MSGITDVPGIRVGHWTHESGFSGCTVVLTEEGAVGGVDVRGPAPDTYRTDLLTPSATVERVHAVLLAGGSAYGLAAADGVMAYLEGRGIGFRVGDVVVPIVVGAVIFDQGARDPALRPDSRSGFAACTAATSGPTGEGRVGAGAGATIGKLYGDRRPGGVGTASLRVGGATVGAIVVVNSLGDVVEESGIPIDFSGRSAMSRLLDGEIPPSRSGGDSTTIGVVATDAAVTRPEASLLARVAHDGLAIGVRPAHLRLDGDTFFALGTDHSTAVDLNVLQAAAVSVTVEAIRRAIR